MEGLRVLHHVVDRHLLEDVINVIKVNYNGMIDEKSASTRHMGVKNGLKN